MLQIKKTTRGGLFYGGNDESDFAEAEVSVANGTPKYRGSIVNENFAIAKWNE